MTQRVFKPHHAHRRHGFSFTEILFAVMILGIGFIMIAAMFPVAIHQTEASNQETIAASLGRAGADCLSKVALIQEPVAAAAGTPTTSLLVPTFTSVPPAPMMPTSPPASTVVIPGQVWSMYDTVHDPVPAHAQLLWGAVGRNLIQQIDPRFGWVAMYRRDYIAQGAPSTTGVLSPAPYAQVIIIGVQSHNNPAYVNGTGNLATPTDAPTKPSPGMLLPQYCSGASMTPPTSSSPFSTITFQNGAHVAEGSYVIVCWDYHNGAYDGRIYRIGVLDQGTTWEFLPGQGMSSSDISLPSVDVFVVGPGCDYANTNIRGASEAISAYSTYIAVPN